MVIYMQTRNVMELAEEYINGGNEIPYDFFVTYFPEEIQAYESLGHKEFEESIKNLDHESSEYKRAVEFMCCCDLNIRRHRQLYPELYNANNLQCDPLYFADFDDTQISYPTGPAKK